MSLSSCVSYAPYDSSQVECLGPFVAAFLTPAAKVQRSDGSKVQPYVKSSTWNEIKEISKLFITSQVSILLFLFLSDALMMTHSQCLLLLPICAYATYPLSWVGSYLTLYFSVRSRALASLISAIVQILGNLATGTFLDWRRFTVNQRARYAFIAIMSLTTGTWVYATVIQVEYSANNPKLDWADAGWARGWFLYILVQLNFALIYNYMFWIIGGLTANANETVRWSALIRGIEAAGGAVACEYSGWIGADCQRESRPPRPHWSLPWPSTLVFASSALSVLGQSSESLVSSVFPESDHMLHFGARQWWGND